MRSALIAGMLLVTACKPAADATHAAEPAQDTPDQVAASSKPVGSKLSASVSPLTGTISGFSVRATDLGTVVALDTDVLFDFDKAILRPDAEAALTKAAELIRSGGSGSIAVFGFTDAKGSDDYNLELSRQRAQAVTDWLLKQPGIRSHDFEVRGKGEAEPIAPNAHADGSDDPAGRAKNRRVEIVIPKV